MTDELKQSPFKQDSSNAKVTFKGIYTIKYYLNRLSEGRIVWNYPKVMCDFVNYGKNLQTGIMLHAEFNHECRAADFITASPYLDSDLVSALLPCHCQGSSLVRLRLRQTRYASTLLTRKTGVQRTCRAV